MLDTVAGPEIVRGLQERVARALPAGYVECVDGWWLRHAPGCSWWVGTVLPHGGGNRQELSELVRSAERFYASRGVSSRVQISPPACPDELDGLLSARGYLPVSPMSLQIAPGRDVRAGSTAGPQARVDEVPTPEWFEAWSRVHGHAADSAAEWELLGRVAQPSAYASVSIGGAIVAVGRAVADSRWTGIFGMGALPTARGRGHGAAVLGALADWAVGQGASRMYLQVERDNDPATGLYRKAGFTELVGYHYRAAPRIRDR